MTKEQLCLKVSDSFASKRCRAAVVMKLRLLRLSCPRQQHQLPPFGHQAEVSGHCFSSQKANSSRISLSTGLVDPVANDRIAKKAPFSESRGLELALCLRLADRSQVLAAIEKKAFLLCVLEAASKGLWASSRPSVCSPPDLPESFIERSFFKEVTEALLKADSSEDQHWLALSGQGGAGKTICAAFLAQQAPASLVLWIHFGQRSDEAVFESAKDIVRKWFPSSDPDQFETPKDFLRNTLTRDATEDILFIADDLWNVRQLEPFKNVKMALLTSRSRMCREVRKQLEVQELDDTVDIPLSLEESEGLERARSSL